MPGKYEKDRTPANGAVPRSSPGKSRLVVLGEQGTAARDWEISDCWGECQQLHLQGSGVASLLGHVPYQWVYGLLVSGVVVRAWNAGWAPPCPGTVKELTAVRPGGPTSRVDDGVPLPGTAEAPATALASEASLHLSTGSSPRKIRSSSSSSPSFSSACSPDIVSVEGPVLRSLVVVVVVDRTLLNVFHRAISAAFPDVSALRDLLAWKTC